MRNGERRLFVNFQTDAKISLRETLVLRDETVGALPLKHYGDAAAL
jgi:hypothetical protein